MNTKNPIGKTPKRVGTTLSGKRSASPSPKSSPPLKMKLTKPLLKPVERKLVEGDLEDLRSGTLPDADERCNWRVEVLEARKFVATPRLAKEIVAKDRDRAHADRTRRRRRALSRNLDAIEAALPNYLATAHRFAGSRRGGGGFISRTPRWRRSP